MYNQSQTIRQKYAFFFMTCPIKRLTGGFFCRCTKIFFTFFFVFVLFISAVFFSSCRVTRYVPDDKYMLNRNTIRYDSRLAPRAQVNTYLRQRPNKRVLGVKFHLGIYNLSGKKDRRLNRWLREIGEEPVVLDPFLTQKTADQLRLFFVNKGYRNAVVCDTVKLHKRKAEVIYSIDAHQPFHIGRINWEIADTLLARIIFSDTASTLLHSGDLFDISVLEQERLRIEKIARNKGYYGFSRDYIIYRADTSALTHKSIDILIIVKNPIVKTAGGYLDISHPVYRIRNIVIHLDYDPQRVLLKDEKYLSMFDTMEYRHATIISIGEPLVKPKTLLQSVYLTPDSLFSVEDDRLTYKHLSSLRIFKFINIKYLKAGDDSLYMFQHPLDCYIQLNTLPVQSYTTEVEGTNSSGDLGVGGSIGYQHKNLFGGAEILDVSLHGSMEAMKQRYDIEDSPDNILSVTGIRNTMEFTSEIKIAFPKFILPFFRADRFVKQYNPKTLVGMTYNYQKRPDYTRRIVNVSFGYNWHSAKYFTHTINPAEINFVRLPTRRQQSDFLKRIEGTYLENSFNDHFIADSRYNVIFNNQKSGRKNFIFISTTIETAGNMLAAISSATNRPFFENSYQLFGVPFAQYGRADFDVRYYQALNRTDKFVYRVFAGAGLPYNNSNALPFEKKYFTGGANGIRAWQVRTLGPGTFRDTLSRFPNSLGDMKVEASFEYRFDIFWVLEGALFIDAGNIWALSVVDDRPGALFNPGTFFSELAVGTGFGTRFDFSFFVFRVDVGIKARDPSVSGQNWILGSHKLISDDWNFVLGIGYPF